MQFVEVLGDLRSTSSTAIEAAQISQEKGPASSSQLSRAAILDDLLRCHIDRQTAPFALPKKINLTLRSWERVSAELVNNRTWTQLQQMLLGWNSR